MIAQQEKTLKIGNEDWAVERNYAWMKGRIKNSTEIDMEETPLTCVYCNDPIWVGDTVVNVFGNPMHPHCAEYFEEEWNYDSEAEIVKNLTNDLNKANARIERLEKRLDAAGLPSYDATCQCCGSIYIPSMSGPYESVRCSACCVGCIRPAYSDEWIKGKNCPAAESKE